jgi:phage recombination protein Bet
LSGTAVAKAGDKGKLSLVATFAARLGVEPTKMLDTLRSTCFSTGKNDRPVTNEEMMALLVVAEHYHLNPFLKEIYAFPKKGGGIVPIIGYDGWVKLVQAQPMFEGETLVQGFDEKPFGDSDVPMGLYYECSMYRKDRKVPTVVREYLRENFRDTDPWRAMPNRMTRMRAYIQCARIAFGFGGIYDNDEGEVISVSTGVDLLPATAKGGTTAPQARADAPLQLANDEHVEMIIEKLAKTGLADNLVLAKFEVGAFNEIPADKVMDVLKFIQDQAP